MKDTSSLDSCLSFISSQAKPPSEGKDGQDKKLAITLSRQTGAGAWLIAPRLIDLLRRSSGATDSPWTVFDRELVEAVLADHNLPGTLAKFMPEDRVPYLQDALQELLGLHPPSWTLVEKTTETIRKLLKAGNVVVIGRGSNLIGANMKHVLHVRLVGSLDKRVECAAKYFKLERKSAREFVVKADRGRERYLREHFNVAVDDPLIYDLTINTDRVPYEEAARLIASAASRRADY